MVEPQRIVETWLSEALHRTLYEGHDVAQRLRRVQEYLGSGERPEQVCIQDWLANIDEKSTYEAKKLINPLLELWGLVTAYETQEAVHV